MNMQGNLNATLFKDELVGEIPSLCIAWGKYEKEFYIHHAFITFKSGNNNLFRPDQARVEVIVRENFFIKGKIWKYVDTKLSKYLPVEYYGDKVVIPLNAWEIVEALEANLWTSSKKKKNINLKIFPASISFAFAENFSESAKFCFSAESRCTPYLLSEPYLVDLPESNCQTLLIYKENGID